MRHRSIVVVVVIVCTFAALAVQAQSCPTQSQAAVGQSPSGNITPTSGITYTWTPASASGVTGNDILVAETNGSPTVACSTTAANATSCTGGALARGGYNFAVRTKILGCPDLVSSPKSFTVGCTTTGATIQNPPDGSQTVGTTTTLQWSSVASATSYDVYFGQMGAACTGQPSFTTSSTSFNPPQLTPSTAYEWRVSAKFGDTCPAVSSACATFKTTASCNQPGSFNLTSPTNNASITTSPPTLTWTPSSGADRYVIHIGVMNPPTAQASDPQVSGNVTSFTFASALPATKYFWYVDAIPACGTSGKISSQVFNFTIPSCPDGVATIVSPTASTFVDATQPIAFTWNAVHLASSYDVLVSTDGANYTAIAGGLTGSPFSKQLERGSYYWVVRTNFSNNCASTLSAASRFNAVIVCDPAGSPLLSAPPNNATVTSPVTFDWNDVPAVSGYRLFASFNGGDFSTIAITQSSQYTTAIPAGTVEWYVQTINPSCAEVSSSHFKFTVDGGCPTNPDSPKIVSPGDGSKDLTSPVTFQWSAVANATAYLVYAFSAATNSAPTLLGTTNATSLTASVGAGTFTWYVVAKFGDCASATVSNRATVTVSSGRTCGSNSAPTLLSPSNNATGVTSPVTFQWHAVSGAAAYKLYVASGNATGDLVGTTTDTSLTRLVPDGSVTWAVAAVFSGCDDVVSSPFKFTAGATSSCPTGSITLTAPANGATLSGANSVTFSWTGISGASAYRLWFALNGGTPAVLANTTNTSITLPLPSGSVEWSIEALFGATTANTCPSIFSSRSKFTVTAATNCDTHKAVTLVSPITGSQQTPIDFTWTATDSTATLYRLWVSSNSEGFVDVATTKDTHAKIDIPPGTATWFVESFFAGCPALSSARATFTSTTAEPRCDNSAPINITPTDKATVQAPVTLVWSAVPNAVAYRVFAKDVNATTSSDFTLIAVTTDTSLTQNIPPGTYQWFVEAVFPGCSATKSEKTKFTVAQSTKCGTDIPQLLNPADGATNVDSPVTLEWSPLSGATGYAVFIKRGDDAPTRIAETSDTQITTRVPEGVIQWAVVAYFTGCPPLQSKTFTFTTKTSTCDNKRALLHSPDDGEVTVSPVRLSWSNVPNATQFKVWASVNGGGSSVVGTTTDNKLTTDAPAGTIQWFVESFFANCPSTVSTTQSFIVRKTPPCATPDRPVATVVGETASGTPYTVRWTALANVTTYELQESLDADFTDATTTNVGDISVTFTHTATDKPVRYYYRVRGISSCSDDHGRYSLPVAIFILPPKPASANSRQSGVEFGVQGKITQTIQLPAQNPPTTFVATADKPWVTVTPSSGLIGADGATLTVVSDPSPLALGTNTATIKVTYGASGKTGSNATSTVSVPISISLVTPISSTGKNAPPPDSLIIPAVGHAAGANDSLFQSDVRVANLSAKTQKYQLNFTLTNTDGTQSGQSTTIQVDPGTTMALDDILSSFFGIGTDGTTGATGVLEVRPLSSSTSSFTSGSSVSVSSVQTIASSKTYNQTSNGTFGQYIAAAPFSSFIGKAPDGQAKAILSLQQIAQSAAYRTNFGIVEAAGEPADVLVHVFDNAGNELKQIPISLQPGEHKQLNNFLAANDISVTDGRIETEVVSATGKVTTYASVVDNITNDPLCVSPVLKGSGANQKFAIPGVADLNTGFASWRSDLRIFNAGSSSTTATLSYYPNSANPVTKTINAGEVLVVDNALQNLYGLTNSGGQIIVTTPSTSNLVVTARTYNQTSNGTYGQFIPGVTPAQSVGFNERTLQLLQLEQSDRYRTNIGVSETNGQPVDLEVTVVPSDSKVVGKVALHLDAYQFTQFSLNDFGFGTLYNARVTVKATSGSGRITAYGSVIDQITQDPTYVPAQ
jgi:hypothetical protein